MRRLRSNDGVFFTKSGALKLAHYVEREIRRYMNSRVTPVALPSGPVTPVTPDDKPAARPVAGPVVPLTVTPGNSEELLGGAGNSSPHGDAIATRVLVKGEAVTAPPGRADDFALQRGGDANVPPVATAPAGALASAPADTAPIECSACAGEESGHAEERNRQQDLANQQRQAQAAAAAEARGCTASAAGDFPFKR